MIWLQGGKSMQYKFRCPYCFSVCSHDQVYFRATIGYDPEELSQLAVTLREEEQCAVRRFAKNTLQSPALEKMVRFWRQRGGTTALQEGDKGWNMPYIDPAAADFAEMIRAVDTGNLNVGWDGFVRDEDGFVCRVVDRFGSPDQEMKRLCPHCLNPLPLQKYGKYHLCFIALAGMSGAGKTVYLQQLLTVLRKNGARMGWIPGEDNFDTFLQRGETDPLPSPTNPDQICRPLAINMHTPDGKDGVTLVFYDLAGSQLSRNKSSGGQVAELDCLVTCDVLLLMIDPRQIKCRDGERAVPLDRLQEVFECLKNMKQDLWTNVPVAVTLTKADSLQGEADFQDIWQKTVSYEKLNLEQQPNIFKREWFAEENGAVKKFIERNNDAAYEIFCQMGTPAYFAVSALGCGTAYQIRLNHACYRITKEDIEKIEKTRQWIEEWKAYGACIQARQQMPECPCGLHREVSAGMNLEDLNQKSFVTKIVGINQEDGRKSTFTLHEILTGEIVSCPEERANPQAVQLPLRWSLWQLGLLKPDFGYIPAPRQPKYGLFRKKQLTDQQWNAEWEQLCRRTRSRFYNGEKDYQSEMKAFKKTYHIVDEIKGRA